MDLKNYRKMDPVILFSILNTKLRDFSEDLKDLSLEHNIDIEELTEYMKSKGFIYSEETNQFRSI